MLVRSRTAKYALPQPQEHYLKNRQELKEKTKQLFSRQSSRSSQRKISTALFNTTSRTNNLFKPHSQMEMYRERGQYTTIQIDTNPIMRPLTHDSRRCRRSQSPLSVIKMRSDTQTVRRYQEIRHKRNNFLKGGSSIDKAIIGNILKSKLNKNVCAPSFSYCDHNTNRELISIISQQIPKGIKDVVGVQQMIRMSHIFTGSKFQAVSLTKKVNQTLQNAKKIRKQEVGLEEDDVLTLRSIKRW